MVSDCQSLSNDATELGGRAQSINCLIYIEQIRFQLWILISCLRTVLIFGILRFMPEKLTVLISFLFPKNDGPTTEINPWSNSSHH